MVNVNSTWCELQNELASAIRKHFDRWPDAWNLYCDCRTDHPLWPNLDLGQKLHVMHWYLDELVGDVREIDGQWVSDSGKVALHFLLNHVRCHVPAGRDYRRRCDCCDPNLLEYAKTHRIGTLFVNYHLAKRNTSQAVLAEFAKRVARAPQVTAAMMVRMMYQNAGAQPESGPASG